MICSHHLINLFFHIELLPKILSDIFHDYFIYDNSESVGLHLQSLNFSKHSSKFLWVLRKHVQNIIIACEQLIFFLRKTQSLLSFTICFWWSHQIKVMFLRLHCSISTIFIKNSILQSFVLINYYTESDLNYLKTVSNGSYGYSLHIIVRVRLF